MKKTANVVIIGGGVIGCSLACFLATRIKDVVLLEKNQINSEASGANFGMVWLQSRPPGFDLNMTRRCQKLYDELISEDFDIDIEYEKKGGMTVYFNENQLKVMAALCKQKQKFGVPISIIDRADTLALEPNLSQNVLGAMFCGEDVHLNPLMTTLAFARLAIRRGVTIYTDTEVTGIEVLNGEVTAVQTNRGEISCPIVVNAAGAWARKIANMVGIDLPVFPQRLQALVTEPFQKLLNRVIQGAREISKEDVDNPEKANSFAFEFNGKQTEENLPKVPIEDSIFTFVRPTKSGTIVIGTTSEFVGYNHSVTPTALSLMTQKAVELFPRLKNANIIRTWANFVPFTYDALPVLGKVEGVDGLIMATGHAHGVAHAPATAEVLTQLIVDGKTDVPLDEVSYSRFLAQNTV